MHLKSVLLKSHFRIGILVASCGFFVFFLLWLLYPEIVYDQFIWKYLWGPILSDGLNRSMVHNGVPAAPKFTLVSYIVYGVVIAVAIYGIYKLLKKWDITVDFSFLLGLMPFILYGSIARVLEDAQLFTAPIVFCFVTPLIYIQTLVITVLSLTLAVYLKRAKTLKKLSVQQITGIIGMIFFLPSLYYVLLWLSGNTWKESNDMFPIVFPMISIICVSITTGVYIMARSVQSYWKDARILSAPLNLSMIFGHLFDGISTYFSIYDPLHFGFPPYVEKHPASDLLMQVWPPLFPIVKFFLAIGIIYVIDVIYKDELRQQPLFVNLLKMGIFILGFAPGFRNLLRVTMGV